MKRQALRPGKKCKECNGKGKKCKVCLGRGFVIKPKLTKKKWPANPSAKEKTNKPRAKKRVSKRHELNKQYGKLRKAFMLLNPRCQVIQPSGRACGAPSTDCHHRKGRKAFFLDESTFLSTCANCHREIHTTLQLWARKMGYLLNPISKEPIPPLSTKFIPYETCNPRKEED